MNNKLIWLCMGVMATVGLTSGTFFYHDQLEKVQTLSSSLEQQKQKVAVLNDQLVVLQRNITKSMPLQTTLEPTSTAVDVPHDKENYVKDYIELIQLNIQQQQFGNAMSNIQQLKQKLLAQPLLRDALNQAVLEALQTDQVNLHQYVKYRSEHLLLLQTHLTELEKMIQPTSLDQHDAKWDFKQWFKLSKSENIPDLENRDLIYRHLQLKILLAQQALMAGQVEFYQQQISDIKTQLQQYPDTQTQRILVDFNKIKNIPIHALPQITALALVRGV